MFARYSKPFSVEYDPDKQRAVLRCSICNGERVAGFKDKLGNVNK